jgi:hypothetical protein
MTNYVTSVITITGPEDTVYSFFEENQLDDTNNFDLFKLNPLPNFHDDEEAQDKWLDENVSTTYLEPDTDEWRIFLPNKIEGLFYSPWAPPVAWLQKLSTKYPKLDFKLAALEEGNNVYYDVFFKEGTIYGTEANESWGSFIETWHEKEWDNIDDARQEATKFLEKFIPSPNMKEIALSYLLYELEN